MNIKLYYTSNYIKNVFTSGINNRHKYVFINTLTISLHSTQGITYNFHIAIVRITPLQKLTVIAQSILNFNLSPIELFPPIYANKYKWHQRH